MGFSDEGGYLRGLQAGRGDGGEGLLVPEGDPELLSEGLRDHSVPEGKSFTEYATEFWQGY